MKAHRISLTGIVVLLTALIVIAAVVLLARRFEGEPPTLLLNMDSASMGATHTLDMKIADPKSGLRQVWVGLIKDGREIVLLDKTYPAGHVLSGGSVKEDTVAASFEAKAQGVTDGKALLRVKVRDFSWRKWAKGNQVDVEQEVLIDTQPPAIDILTRVHNIQQGGAGLVVYKLAEDCRTSGVQVGEEFYPGMSAGFSDPKVFMTFFALNHLQGPGTKLMVTATDLAGNQGRSSIPSHINAKKFKHDTIPISDGFLTSKIAEFKPQIPNSASMTPVELFLAVNGELRRANYEVLKKAVSRSDNKVYWQGEFLRLPRAAPRAGFADKRTYVYAGKPIDEQTHLGVDLASLEQSPVPAANAGKISFAEDLGIYGNTVMIDHGFGLFSMYSHLSTISVTPGQEVQKGDIVGKTGLTGLAGGDHLHFSMMVYHTFVNPIEWWDPQWIKDKIQANLQVAK